MSNTGIEQVCIDFLQVTVADSSYKVLCPTPGKDVATAGGTNVHTYMQAYPFRIYDWQRWWILQSIDPAAFAWFFLANNKACQSARFSQKDDLVHAWLDKC